MKKRLLIVLIFVIFGLVVLASGCTQQSQNATSNNTIQNSTVQNATQNSTVQGNKTDISGRYNDIIITQKGPNAPQKRGTSVLISYTITNNGKNRVYNVLVWSQDFGKNVGTLNPGQTLKYTYLEYIPTDKDLASWYDNGVKLISPFEIGGIYLSFKDDKGVPHRIQSNSISIKLE
jgi:hypothetical protein